MRFIESPSKKGQFLVFNQVAEAYPAVPLGGVAAAPPEDAAEAAEGDDEEEDEGAE